MPKPPNGRIVAQLRYASRLSGNMAGQDYLGGILLRFCDQQTYKCDVRHQTLRPRNHPVQDTPPRYCHHRDRTSCNHKAFLALTGVSRYKLLNLPYYYPMRRFFCLPLLAAILLSFAAQAQSGGSPASQGSKTKSQDAVPSKPEAPKHDYSQEAYVIEQYHSFYRFEEDGTGRRETTARIRVQSEAGVQQWGQIQVGYNSANERVEIPYVRVVKADGTVVKAGDDAVQDLSAPLEQQAPVYTDYRQKHITVPGLRPGEVLEYHMVTVIHTALAPGEFWTDYDFDKTNIDLDEQVDIDVPADRPLKLKNKPGMDPKISEASGRRIYHWTSSHLEREDDQKDKDKDKEKAKAKAKKKKKVDEDRPDVQLTTFVSWEQIGRWYASLEKDRRTPSPEVRAKADELTKGLGTQLDKVEGLYDFVAKNFRYV